MINYALITGATSGIGYELAKIFAANGFGLVLVSSHAERLHSTKAQLQEKTDVPIHIFAQDLSRLGAAQQLYESVKQAQLPISVLVNNAGFGLVGATHEIDLAQDERMLILNVISPVELCKLFLADWAAVGQAKQAKRGKILNVASTGAFQPGPYTSTYFASKAFVLSYSRAIRYEAKKLGVQVSTLCPGSTKTRFFDKEGMPTPAMAMSAERVARIAFRGLMRNREVIVPGILNQLARPLPMKLKIAAIARMKASDG